MYEYGFYVIWQRYTSLQNAQPVVKALRSGDGLSEDELECCSCHVDSWF